MRTRFHTITKINVTTGEVIDRRHFICKEGLFTQHLTIIPRTDWRHQMLECQGVFKNLGSAFRSLGISVAKVTQNLKDFRIAHENHRSNAKSEVRGTLGSVGGSA